MSRKELGSTKDYVCNNAKVVSWGWRDNTSNDGKTFVIRVRHPHWTRADGTFLERWHPVFDEGIIAKLQELDDDDPYVWADIERRGLRVETHCFWDNDMTEDIWNEEQ